MRARYTVVSYDVSDDKRRGKIAKILMAYGQRVQKSVFDCVLEERAAIELRRRLSRWIEPQTDSVRYYSLCAACQRRIEIDGKGDRASDDPVVIL